MGIEPDYVAVDEAGKIVEVAWLISEYEIELGFLCLALTRGEKIDEARFDELERIVEEIEAERL